jgi:hypothetical protein
VAYFQLLFENAQNIEVAIENKIWKTKICSFKNTTDVSERREPQSNKSAKNSCDKHNLSTSNKKVHVISVKTEIDTHENNFCTGERDCAQDRNTVV